MLIAFIYRKKTINGTVSPATNSGVVVGNGTNESEKKAIEDGVFTIPVDNKGGEE